MIYYLAIYDILHDNYMIYYFIRALLSLNKSIELERYKHCYRRIKVLLSEDKSIEMERQEE